MAVENRIVKVQKRNRALVRFNHARIRDAILRAADPAGTSRLAIVASRAPGR